MAVFGLADFDVLSELVLDAWSKAVDRDWSVPAGTLEWSCLRTADHTIDCVFSYAFFLASRKEDGYPNFGELHALDGATAADMLDGLRAVIEMLHAAIAVAPPEARATIMRRPEVVLGSPEDFAARGALELILHGHDVCRGLGVPLDPPADVCSRLLAATSHYPGHQPPEPTDDPWSDLLARSGRPRP